MMAAVAHSVSASNGETPTRIPLSSPAGHVDARQRKDEPQQDEGAALAQHEPRHPALGGAERHSDRQLALPAHDRRGDDAKEPHRRQQQRRQREAGDEHDAQPLLPHRFCDQRLHLTHVGECELRIHLPQRGSHLRHEIQGRRACPEQPGEVRRGLVPDVDLEATVAVEVVVAGVVDDTHDRQDVVPRPGEAARRSGSRLERTSRQACGR